MERRGRIPIAKFRTQEGKTRSRSRVREPDYNEQDPETDLFTLLEDNIALKEENKSLKLEIEAQKKLQTDMLDDKAKLHDELQLLKKRQANCETEMKEIRAKFAKASNERTALEKLHKMRLEMVDSLTNELELLKNSQQTLSAVVVDSIGLKSKLLKVLPTLTSNEMESIVDVESPLATTNELVERLVDEFLVLKNSMNAVELQLYEANEKISDLLENQHHLEEENETLRSENTNLTKVAKLLTENMKESVETSKKMEAALIKLKQRNDELTAKSHDLTDGQPSPSPSPTTLKANEEFEQMTAEVETQNRDHNERIVEMKSLMEAAIQKNTNDELKTLQLKLEILEEELRKAITRADLAETELEKYKKRDVTHPIVVIPTSIPTPPPPPPPPMPANLLYEPRPLPSTIHADQHHQANAWGGTFSDNIASHNLHKGEKIIDTVKQQVQAEAATGLDALVREFKSGRVTLRRNRRKTRTNDALQEMFQVLEVSQKQNRDSKICIDMHL